MEELDLIADAAEGFFQVSCSTASNRSLPLGIAALDSLIDLLVQRQELLLGNSPFESNPYLDSLIQVSQIPSDRLVEIHSFPLSSDTASAFLAICVLVESKRQDMRQTTCSFLSYIKKAWNDACSTRFGDSSAWVRILDQEDPLLAFRGVILPTTIDFEKRRLYHPVDMLLNHPVIEIDMIWLGVGPHDGYPMSRSVVGYGDMRQGHPNFPWRQHPLIWQSTLTFGLLEAVMDLKIPESFLLEPLPDGRTIMAGRCLSMLIFDWQIRLNFTKIVDEAAYRSWIYRTTNAFEEARAIMDGEMAHRHLVRAGFWQVEVNRLVCAIGTLIEVLGHAAGIFTQAMSPSSSMYVQTARFVNQVKLQSAGWCQFVVGALVPSLSVQNYATRRKPFVRSDVREHEHCSSTHCTIHNIDPDTYVAQHATQDCTCAYLKPPVHSVMELLSRGQIPVLVHGADGALTVRSASEGPYVAISHVWVDGLGSNTEVGLPACQVSRLTSLTASLVPDGAFWQDGLCVPADKPMRKFAIGLMAKTYAEAAKVVVIDTGVRTLCSTTMTLEDNLLRLATSGWMQRIWTLQEGLLARELYFEFADGLVRAEELKRMETGAIHPCFLPFNPIASALLGALIFVSRGNEHARQRTFPELLRLLHHRTTSKHEDETLAIAGLVGVDAGELVALQTAEERMVLFLQRVKNLPRDIICFGGTKLRKTGFRWAPLTLTRTVHLKVECDAICTETGLMAEYSLLRFPEMDLPIPYGAKTFIRNPETGQHYEILPSMNFDNEECHRFNALLLTENKLPERLEGFQCATVLIDHSVTRTDKLICRYVNNNALIGHGDDLGAVLPLLAPLKQPHTIVEGRSSQAFVLVT